MRTKLVEDPFGITWKVREHTDDFLAAGQHEAHLASACVAVLPEGGTFVDVGAHVGLYALRLATKAGRVVALEANERTFDSLVENVLLNDHLAEKIESRNLAAWHSSGEEIQLFDANGKASGGSTGAYPVGQQTSVGRAMTVTLDHLLLPTDRVDLIKIDVEGAEADVLKGARHVMEQLKPAVFIEMHDVYVGDQNREIVEDLLDLYGYTHGPDIHYGGGYHWMCRPKETA